MSASPSEDDPFQGSDSRLSSPKMSKFSETGLTEEAESTSPTHSPPPASPFKSPYQTSPPDSQQPSLRSRASSITESFRSIFTPKKKKSRKRTKPPRDRSARPTPERVNILDKDNTSKLNKFWNSLTGEREESSPPQVVVSGTSVGSGSSRILPSIEEDPVLARYPFRAGRLAIMDTSRLTPEASLDGEKKQKAIQDAKDMYQHVLRSCERTNTTVPPYDFIELIGKGAFGRVYKCRERKTGELVAIKIVNTDDVDYAQDTLDKDDTIKDFRKEVTILQQLKDSNAKNVNMIHGAFDLQEQLWIVSDYCTGGSIRTLMRAQPASHPGLEEQYIIPIARELALAIKSVHDIDVIHRDIKCTNVYVTEEGQIQLGDFGIVGVMDDGSQKRRTMIGTPHYMPREMHIRGAGNQVAESYGTEIDIWSFGCSVYEMATGQPPNALKSQNSLNVVLLNAPRLEGGNYSQELRDFIAFCLNSDPKLRPTADEVLKHPYVANTQRRHPTRKLVDLIHRFKAWEYGGGWRQSLFFAGGAPPVSGGGDREATPEDEDLEDWNFSTSDSFNAAFDKRYSQMLGASDPSSLRLDTRSGTDLPSLNTNLTPYEQIQQRQKDLSANRGERSLGRLWSFEDDPYELHTPIDDPEPMSDLPLRNLAGPAPTRESHIMIDLDSAASMDDAVPTLNFDFGDLPTLKAKNSRQPSRDDDDDYDYSYNQTDEDREKRATMEWKFPAQKRVTMDWKFPTTQPTEPDDPNKKMNLPAPGEADDLPPGFQPTIKRTTTEPAIGEMRATGHYPQQSAPPSISPIRESMRSMIDLDLDMDPADIPRPSTASSATGSIMSDVTSGNPFDLEEDPAQNEIDRNRFSYHKQWQSEGGQMKRSSRRSIPMHTRGSSLSSTASDIDRRSGGNGVFNYEYDRRFSSSSRNQLNGTLPDESADISSWPDFGTESGFDRARTYTDSLDDVVQRSREPSVTREMSDSASEMSMQRPLTSRPIQPEIHFPRMLPPHPNALLEDAESQMMITEMSRLLDDFGDSLRATATALQQHTGVGDDDGASESESFDSSAHATGDEEGL